VRQKVKFLQQKFAHLVTSNPNRQCTQRKNSTQQ